MSPIAYTATIIAAAVVLFVWNRLPVVVVAMATALALWATRRPDARPGARRLRRSGGHLHRLALRRQRRARDDRRHGLGRPASDPRRGRGEPDAPSAPDDEPGGAAHRADQRQRRGRRSAAGRRRHRGPAQAELVAAADAAGLLRACRLDAGADRHAGERAGLGGRQSMPASAASASSSSPWSACRCSPARWRSSSCSASGCCPSATAPRCRPISAATPRRWSSNTASPSGIYPAARARDLALCRACRRRRSTSRPFPDLQLVAVQEGETAAPLRRPVIAEGDHLLLRGDAEAAAALAARDASRVPRGRGGRPRRGDAVQPPLRPCRSGDPAALGPRSARPCFPGMVTESGDLIVLAVQRGRRRDRRRQREREPERHRAAGRRHDAAAGNLEGARRPSRRSRRAGRQLARAGAPPGRADGTGRTTRPSPSWSRWSSCSPPASCRPPWPACSPPAPSSCRGS